MKKNKKIELKKSGWDHEPDLGEIIDDIFENYMNITIEMGGINTFWFVVKGNGRAIVPVQISSTLLDSAKQAWLLLNKK